MESKIKSNSNYSVEINLTLTESEARALSVLPSYGTKNFLDFFYIKLGRHYLEPHEKGLISLFETIKNELPKHLSKVDEVREIINTKP